MTTPQKLIAEIGDRTPAHRDRAIDGLCALPLLAVPAGRRPLGGSTLDTGISLLAGGHASYCRPLTRPATRKGRS
ncbi:hypothetical protein [Sinosporangium siamense]|uniref:Uncharacterized protein n=1 Tax=Sinosporangium siamense TaxID=1367973 RepID=A0A919RPC9_9ACTN|nr:hypothetical protein [Sinosporangium siamense]GII96822.1 hypothetical protein Ssi02_70530 [Sinosporangium siamense]